MSSTDTDDDLKFQQQKARTYVFLYCVGMLDMPEITELQN